MIPYAIFAGTIEYKNGEKQEIQAIELERTSFTFRLAAEQKLNINEIEAIRLTTLRFLEQRYVTMELSDWEIEEIPELDIDHEDAFESDTDVDSGRGKTRAVFKTYRLVTADEAYRVTAEHVTREYLRYVHLKTESTEAELVHALTGLSEQEPFCDTWEEQRANWMQTIHADLNYEALFDPRGTLPELALSLHNEKLWKAYLSMPFPEFLRFYWSSHDLDRHPLRYIKPTHLYIGDQSCPLHFPSLRTLLALLERALSDGLQLIPVFAPMAEGNIELYKERIKLLPGAAGQDAADSSGRVSEVVINDIGLAALIRELDSEGRIRITAGPFLAKRKKDARLPYKLNEAAVQEANRESAIDISWYRKWLHASGISRFTYETCGYEYDIRVCDFEKAQEVIEEHTAETTHEKTYKENAGSVLELPYYRMNTAGHCTLYAACQNGERGAQVPVKSCPGYCEKACFLYPDNRQMTGIGKTIFGLDRRALEDGEYLKRILRQGIERIVVNIL